MLIECLYRTCRCVDKNVDSSRNREREGKISFKNDDTSNIHVAVGKVSFDSKNLIENIDTMMTIIKKLKPAKVKGIYIRNITLTSSMGPGIKVQIPKA